MCGIVGIYNFKQTDNAIPEIIQRLKQIEYRGYDAVGIAYIDNTGIMSANKTIADIKELEARSKSQISQACIGHTRWSTHGVNNEKNAHPHVIENISISHNGILQNAHKYKNMLLESGYNLDSDTDSEIAVKLIHYYNKKMPILEALYKVRKIFNDEITAVILYIENNIQHLIGVCGTAPILIGISSDKIIMCSDVSGLQGAKQVCYLDSGECAIVKDDSITILDDKQLPIQKASQNLSDFFISINQSQKKTHKHYMYTEILDQIHTIKDTYINANAAITNDLLSLIRNANNVYIIGCGSSYYTATYGQYVLSALSGQENIRNVIASEARHIKYNNNDVILCISQSGETLDAINTIKIAKSYNAKIISIINNQFSMIERASEYVIHTSAGLETSVASTKSFTAQCAALLKLAVRLSHDSGQIQQIENEMNDINTIIEATINECNKKIKKQISDITYQADYIVFLATHKDILIAKEGALKMKEVSYIPSEGMAIGELKHGSIALATKDTACILIQNDKGGSYFSDCANIMNARNANIISIGSSPIEGVDKHHHIAIPKIKSDFIRTIALTIPVQLLAYHTANCRGTNIDKPRNLAKTITV